MATPYKAMQEQPAPGAQKQPVNVSKPATATHDVLLPRTLDGMNNNDCNAFIHLHRAEVQLMVAYRWALLANCCNKVFTGNTYSCSRLRMDSSTNWAVSMTSTK
jgi:uncharacterized membrane protein